MSAPYVPDADCETHEWRSSTGETIRFVTEVGAQQRVMPPVMISTIRVPQTQGGRFRGARHDMRLATIPVVVPGPQSDRDELRRWARALDPLKGEGTLSVVQGPHAGRQLVCCYEAGLDSFEEQWGHIGKTILAFRAADPYWQDAIENGLTVGIDDVAFYVVPFPPLELGASDVFATTTIDNQGDVDAWPIITALGPGDDITVANDTTGESWTFDGTVPDGSQLVVDHRPGHKAARLDGINSFASLTDDSVLWPLIPGPNRITITLVGGTVDSSVSFNWRNRWLSA